MRILLALLLLLTPALMPAWARENASSVASTTIRLEGAVKAPATYSMAQLAAMPSTTVTLAVQGHDNVSGAWTGVPLLTLIQKAVPTGQGSGLDHVIIARGTDNYAVAIAMGEIDPRFEAKSVIVAYQKDGQPLASLRLIVPGDAHAGRDVRDLTALTVR